MTSTMLQSLHLYLRERRLLQACLLQCRTGHWSSVREEQGKEDSRRAKRQSRRTQRSVLRQWKGAFELEDWGCQERPCKEDMHMTDRQLWMWMLGRGRKAQLTSKLKPAWQRWLRQGRTAEFVREQPRQRAMEDRHSTASGQEQRDTFHRSYWTQNGGGEAGTTWQQGPGSSWEYPGGSREQHARRSWTGWEQGTSSSASNDGQSKRGTSQTAYSPPMDPVRVRSLRVMGLSSDRLTSATLRAAFREMALLWHPDRHVGLSKQEAEAKFKEVHDAYQFLSSICVV